MKKQLITSGNTLRALTLLSATGLLLLTSSTNLAQSISQANKVWSAEVIRPKASPLFPYSMAGIPMKMEVAPFALASST